MQCVIPSSVSGIYLLFKEAIFAVTLFLSGLLVVPGVSSTFKEKGVEKKTKDLF